MAGPLLLEGVVLYSQDLERAKAFYRDVLGLAVLLEEDHVVHFDAGSVRLAIHRYPTAGRLEVPEGFIVFAVDDLDARYEELRRRGAEFLGPPADRPYGRVAYLHDPEGHEIGLWEPPPAGTDADRARAALNERHRRVAGKLARETSSRLEGAARVCPIHRGGGRLPRDGVLFANPFGNSY